MQKALEDTIGQDPDEAKPQKKASGAVWIDIVRCKGCGYCVAFCPLGVLVMSKKYNTKGHHYPELVDGTKCSGCDLCGMYCPDFAIHGARVRQPGPKKE